MIPTQAIASFPTPPPPPCGRAAASGAPLPPRGGGLSSLLLLRRGPERRPASFLSARRSPGLPGARMVATCPHPPHPVLLERGGGDVPAAEGKGLRRWKTLLATVMLLQAGMEKANDKAGVNREEDQPGAGATGGEEAEPKAAGGLLLLALGRALRLGAPGRRALPPPPPPGPQMLRRDRGDRKG